MTNPKVVVAMSGGVDSSVAAALLKQQGYDVVGMMLRLWSEPGKEESNRCCTPDSMAQARRVAAKLDIPFYVVDAKNVFRETVVQYFLDGYARGETPNPCLVCNRQIRWTFLLDRALALGADFMATGHYVRIRKDERGKSELLRAVDHSKDQSYVLHVLNQDKLAHALFPVGDYPKTEIRRLAADFGLPTASRADSQDLCFLAGEDYRNFLQRNIDELGLRQLTARDVNWLSDEAPREPFRALVKIRYTAKEAEALVAPLDGGQAKVQFDTPQRDITSGQAAVFYQDGVMLGGGIII